MKIILEIVDGPAKGRKKALRSPLSLSVGRGEASDWPIADDPTMSSQHFLLAVRDDGCQLTDLQSTNGTHFQGQPISTQSLEDGDQFTAGTTVFQIIVKQPARPPTPIADVPTSVDSQQSVTAQGEASAATGDLRRTKKISTSPPKAPEDDGPFTRPDLSSAQAVSEQAPSYQHQTTRPRIIAGAVIEVISDNAAGRKSMLRTGQSVTVGRTERADFVIADPTMSSSHFSIASASGGWQLTDLESTQGTQVNGVRVAATILQSGDEILAGQTRFRVAIGHSVPTGGLDTAGQLFPYQEGVRDEDPGVRRLALEAAAWAGQPWLIDHCREQAARPTPENFATLQILAILGQVTDAALILTLSEIEDLGVRRFDLLASFAHPCVVARLIDTICNGEPEAASAAGSAYQRITGINIESSKRATVVAGGATEPPSSSPAEPDEFEEEFADQVALPDAVKAVGHWDQVSPQYEQCVRLLQGHDLSQMPDQAVLNQLDMQARWEVCLRGAYEGKWKGRPFMPFQA